MTWFKENRFLAGLIAITGVLAAIIIFFGIKLGGTLDEKLEEVQAKENSLKEMKGLNPYPTPENAMAKRDNLKALLDQAKATRDKILTYRPETLDNPPLNEFSAELKQSVDEIKALFPEDKALPANFNLGFEDYAGGPPKESATGVLNYERKALDWIFRELAASGIKEVLNLRREELPAEAGVDWNDPKAMNKAFPPPKPSKPKKGEKKARNIQEEKLPVIAHKMPIELTFRGSEPAVRKFLKSLADSDQYFVQARIARIKNESSIPEIKKSKAGAGAGDADAFGQIAGDEPDEGAPATQILERVSGGENLTVFLSADILLFLADQTFPELK